MTEKNQVRLTSINKKIIFSSSITKLDPKFFSVPKLDLDYVWIFVYI